jgi:hypothetical protein
MLPRWPTALYYGDEIFDWSLGSASLAAPPRRTMQTMGLPEPLRNLFMMKVRRRECDVT